MSIPVSDILYLLHVSCGKSYHSIIKCIEEGITIDIISFREIDLDTPNSRICIQFEIITFTPNGSTITNFPYSVYLSLDIDVVQRLFSRLKVLVPGVMVR